MNNANEIRHAIRDLNEHIVDLRNAKSNLTEDFICAREARHRLVDALCGTFFNCSLAGGTTVNDTSADPETTKNQGPRTKNA